MGSWNQVEQRSRNPGGYQSALTDPMDGLGALPEEYVIYQHWCSRQEGQR